MLILPIGGADFTELHALEAFVNRFLACSLVNTLPSGKQRWLSILLIKSSISFGRFFKCIFANFHLFPSFARVINSGVYMPMALLAWQPFTSFRLFCFITVLLKM